MADQELPELDPLSLDDLEETSKEARLAEDEPIKLTDAPAGDQTGGKIHAFGAGAKAAGDKQYRRALNRTGAGASRCKIFHCKINPGSIQYMEDQINDWLDGADVEIKFATHVVAVMEGKHAEPNLFVMAWF